MNRTLVVKCPECGKATITLDPRRNQPQELGDAVRRAEADGLDLELAAGEIKVGCDCELITPTSKLATKARYRLNLRQVLLILTTIAILLAVFRHPISLLANKDVLANEQVIKAAASPWSFYGWLFFGGPIINPKSLDKSPIVIVMLLANVALAGLLPFAIGSVAVAGFKRLWRTTMNE